MLPELRRRCLPALGVLIALLGLAQAPRASAVTVFGSGTTTVTTPINDDVKVRGGATVRLLPGGTIYGSVEVRDASLIIAGGGVVGGQGLSTIGAAHIAMSDGWIYPASLSMTGGSFEMSGGTLPLLDVHNMDGRGTVSISGGHINEELAVRGSGLVSISGGSIGGLSSMNHAGPIVISGGSITNTVMCEDHSVVQMRDGLITDSVLVHTGSRFSMVGGTIGGYGSFVGAQDEGSAFTWSGGQIGVPGSLTAGWLSSSGGAVVTVVGCNAAMTPADVPPLGDVTYHLTGALQDGSMLDKYAGCTDGGQIVLQESCSPGPPGLNPWPYIIIGPDQADPQIESITPARGPMQQRMIVRGHGFADVQGSSFVLLGGHQIPVLSWTAGAISVLVDPAAYRQGPLSLNAAYSIQVVTPASGGRSNTVDFFLTDGPPAESPPAGGG